MQKYTPEQIRFLALRTVGNFLVLSSLFGMFLTFGPAVKNEITYRYNRFRGVSYSLIETEEPIKIVEATPTPLPHSFFRDLLGNQPQVEILTPVDTEFGIVIPKIAANSKVIANVDAGNYDEYIQALKEGVAHAKGTYFPGEGGNIYLFSHSTDNFWNIGRYNAIFYLLKELDIGDEVDLFYQGRRYFYRVSQRVIVAPNETALINQETGEEQLTLQTCWPPGTTFKRLIVIAKPVGV